MNHSVFDSEAYILATFENERNTDPGKPRDLEDLTKKLNEQFLYDMEMAKQRVTQGFCDQDLRNIGTWFLGIMPAVLRRYKKIRYGSPGFLGRGDTCHAEWDKILDEMIFLFQEALEETCSRTNPYNDEHMQQFSEFVERFGLFGQKLQTEEELAERERTGCSTEHFMCELPEYQETDARYKAAKKELEEYREQCRVKAMELFTKWMPHMW